MTGESTEGEGYQVLTKEETAFIDDISAVGAALWDLRDVFLRGRERAPRRRGGAPHLAAALLQRDGEL
jgi:hypothetical protein